MNRGADGDQEIENTRARRVQSHVVQHQRGVRENQRSGDEKKGAGKVTGDDQLASLELRARMDTHGLVHTFNRGTKFAKSSLGWARGRHGLRPVGATSGY